MIVGNCISIVTISIVLVVVIVFTLIVTITIIIVMVVCAEEIAIHSMHRCGAIRNKVQLTIPLVIVSVTL